MGKLSDWWERNIVKGGGDSVGTATWIDQPSVPTVTQPKPLVRHERITTSLERDEAPRFARSYKTSLTSYVTCEIIAKYGYYGRGREFGGMLRESGGEWVIFDPQNIARKIIDRNLVPLVSEFVRIVQALDAEFVRTQADHFTDKRGQTWINSQRRLSS